MSGPQGFNISGTLCFSLLATFTVCAIVSYNILTGNIHIGDSVGHVLLNPNDKAMKRADNSRRKLPEEYNHKDTVTPRYPDKILYNRVRKCGSTFVLRSLQHVCDRNGIKYSREFFGVLGTRLEDISGDKERVFVEGFSNLSSPRFYQNHVFFANFSKYGKPFPEYINVVREPFPHLVSDFYFMKQRKDLLRTAVGRQSKKFTLDEAIEAKIDYWYNYRSMRGFLCGTNPLCKNDDEEALAITKSNIERYYGPIGITEDLPSFLKVLESLYPSYFAGLHNVLKDKEFKRPINVHKKIQQYSNHTERLMKSRLRLCYDLYYFIKKRFYDYYFKKHVR